MPIAASLQDRTRSDQLVVLRAELTRAQESRGPALPFGIDSLDEVDGNIVTSRAPIDLAPFVNAVGDKLLAS